MFTFVSHPEEFWLAVPIEPQKGSGIMRNFPLKWAVGFSLMYYSRPNGEALGFLYEGGNVFSESVDDYDTFFGVTSTGRPWIQSKEPDNLREQRIAFQAGPRLIEDGSPVDSSELSRNISRNFSGLRPDDQTNRSGLGLSVDGKVIYHACSGTMSDLVTHLHTAGAKEAFALDGGSSVLVMTRPDQVTFGGQSWRIPVMGVMTKIEERVGAVPSFPDEKPDVNYQATKNFRYQEFKCPHCKTVKFTKGFHDLLQRLQILRSRLNSPVIVSSGYRCPEYNRAVNGASESQHMFPEDDGAAADIRSPGFSPPQVAQAAEEIGFRGIGLYRTFTHVDTRQTPAYWDLR